MRHIDTTLVKWLRENYACTPERFAGFVNGRAAFEDAVITDDEDRRWLFNTLGLDIKLITQWRDKLAEQDPTEHGATCGACMLTPEIAGDLPQGLLNWFKTTDLIVIYHVIMPDDTMTFLDMDMKDDFIRGNPGPMVVVESYVNQTEYDKMQEWRNQKKVPGVLTPGEPEAAISAPTANLGE